MLIFKSFAWAVLHCNGIDISILSRKWRDANDKVMPVKQWLANFFINIHIFGLFRNSLVYLFIGASVNLISKTKSVIYIVTQNFNNQIIPLKK